MLPFQALHRSVVTLLRPATKPLGFTLRTVPRSIQSLHHANNNLHISKSQLRAILPRGEVASVAVREISSATWSLFAFYVKVGRVSSLIVVIYGLGYGQGIVDTVSHPLGMQEGMIKFLLQGYGVESLENGIEIVSERRVFGFSTLEWNLGRAKSTDPRTRKVAKIGREIIYSAQQFVRKELEVSIEKALLQEDIKITKDIKETESLIRKLREDPKVVFWANSLERLEGERVQGVENWQFVLIKSPISNAFVSEMLPQRLFVTTGVFDELVNNDDELAMILAHEISHVVLGHTSQRVLFQSFIRGFEILLLMFDRTDGLLSIVVSAFLASTREALIAAQSRSHETEADELGCRIAAMSCFDTKRGAEVFKKMKEHEETNDLFRNGVLATHPTSHERYRNLIELTEENNFEKYSYCTTLQKRIAPALKRKNYN